MTRVWQHLQTKNHLFFISESKECYQAELACCTLVSKMGDDEEEGITIWKGDEKHEFSVAEANNPKKIQLMFQLVYEPTFVLSKKDKRVEFGKLKDGWSYKIAESSKIPNLKGHTQNAVILSQAVYSEDPTNFLNKRSTSHSVHTICGITKYSDQKLMVAIGEVEKSQVLYYACRGSTFFER